MDRRATLSGKDGGGCAPTGGCLPPGPGGMAAVDVLLACNAAAAAAAVMGQAGRPGLWRFCPEEGPSAEGESCRSPSSSMTGTSAVCGSRPDTGPRGRPLPRFGGGGSEPDTTAPPAPTIATADGRLRGFCASMRGCRASVPSLGGDQGATPLLLLLPAGPPPAAAAAPKLVLLLLSSRVVGQPGRTRIFLSGPEPYRRTSPSSNSTLHMPRVQGGSQCGAGSQQIEGEGAPE